MNCYYSSFVRYARYLFFSSVAHNARFLGFLKGVQVDFIPLFLHFPFFLSSHPLADPPLLLPPKTRKIRTPAFYSSSTSSTRGVRSRLRRLALPLLFESDVLVVVVGGVVEGVVEASCLLVVVEEDFLDFFFFSWEGVVRFYYRKWEQKKEVSGLPLAIPRRGGNCRRSRRPRTNSGIAIGPA